MPFARTEVIPLTWSRHHTKTVTSAMNAWVEVGEATGSTTYDPGTDDTTQVYSVLYSGPARIQELNGSTSSPVADQNLRGRSYLVQLDFGLASAEFDPGMRVKVREAPNDAVLVGQDLWVIDPQLGSERFTRDLVCSDNQTDAPSV
jgi:hypothetical protein